MVEQHWDGIYNFTITNRTTWRRCWTCGKKIGEGNKYHKWKFILGRSFDQEDCVKCFEYNMRETLANMQRLVALMTSEHWLRDDMNMRRREVS